MANETTPPKETLRQKWEKLPTEKKIGAGISVAALLGAAASTFWPKKAAASSEPAAGTAPAPGAGDTPMLEPMYSVVPAVNVNFNQLPLLRPIIGSTPGSTYWVLGDDINMPDQAVPAMGESLHNMTGFDGALDASGVRTPNNEPVAPPWGDPTKRFISDFAASVAQGPIPTGINAPNGLPPADLWIVALGPSQEKMSVGAMKESLALLRTSLPAQRILWVLSKSVPPETAKALTESKEEWIRSYGDTRAQMAVDAYMAATRPTAESLNVVFPFSGYAPSTG